MSVSLSPAETGRPVDRAPVLQDDLDFARNAREAIRADQVRGANLLLWLIVGAIAAFFAWAAFATIDEVTKGVGKVIPSSSIQTIQNLEGGIVAEIMVSEGARVSTGDVLIRIDDTLSASSYRENFATKQVLEAQLARHSAEAEGLDRIAFPVSLERDRADLIEHETALFEKRRKEQKAQRDILVRSHNLASEEFTMTIPLVRKNIVSKVEQIRLERDMNEIEGKLKDLVGGFQQQAMEKSNETKSELESLTEALEGREDRVNRALVRSPVNGTVNKLYVSTIGDVVQPGEPIVDIVPDDETLLVEAKIRPADIAFLRPGQEAVLKFTAYDFSIYGGLKGDVEHISADTIEDEIDKAHYYQIKVRNKSGKLMKDGEELAILPGMVVEVDVLTGRRTVLQYLTKPFHRMRFNALRER